MALRQIASRARGMSGRIARGGRNSPFWTFRMRWAAFASSWGGRPASRQ